VRKRMSLTLHMLMLAASAQAAEISVGPSLVHGGTTVFIRGEIVPGDERQFRAVAETVSDDVPVVLRSPGGYIPSAIAIGRIVRARGLTTFVGRAGLCASACPLIWLSGRHAVIQRNSYLGFHAGSGERGTAMMESYLRELGLTADQIRYILGTPQPLTRPATEYDASALGIRPQLVSSLLGAWKSCRAKYCLAIP